MCPQAGARGPARVPPELQPCAGRGLVVMAAGRGGAGRDASGDAPEPPLEGERLGAGLSERREGRGGSLEEAGLTKGRGGARRGGAGQFVCDVKLWAQSQKKRIAV